MELIIFYYELQMKNIMVNILILIINYKDKLRWIYYYLVHYNHFIGLDMKILNLFRDVTQSVKFLLPSYKNNYQGSFRVNTS